MTAQTSLLPAGQAPENEAEEQLTHLSNEAVTGHTATLWKYLPVPADEPEPHSEYDTTVMTLGDTTIWGARVRGKKHKHEGTNCDDWFTIAHTGDWLTLAVADGAGSRRLSRVGAKLSCTAAVKALEDSLAALANDHPTLRETLAGEMTAPDFQACCGLLAKAIQNAVLAAWNAVDTGAAERATDDAYTEFLGRTVTRNDLSATLLLTAALPLLVDGKQETFVITCQIGDGTIALLNPDVPADSAVKLMGEPDSGDFAGETDFLTSEKMRQPEQLMPRTRISRSNAQYLFLMSDGVADDYYPSDPQLCRLYLDLLANGVLSDGKKPPRVNDQMLQCLRALPKPISYPWVNDPEQTLAVNSIKQICESVGMSLAEAWELQGVWAHASAICRPLLHNQNPEARLCKWLDHYVERGSFDDRTLLIARLHTPGQMP